MIYTHVLDRGPAGVRSPADALLAAEIAGPSPQLAPGPASARYTAPPRRLNPPPPRR
jgi:hypothetical protein